MYADQIAAGRKRSVRDRLDGDAAGVLPRSRPAGVKRQRQDDGKWKHDLFEELTDPKDLRYKLQKKGPQQTYLSGRNSGVRDLREKLSGVVNSHPPDTDLPKAKRVSVFAETIKKNLQPKPPAPETKRTVKPTSSKRTSQQTSQQKTTLSDSSVDSFLSSLGLDKYHIKFQTEEIDMTALGHMSDEDLRTLGIPMGPRKKIMLALESKS